MTPPTKIEVLIALGMVDLLPDIAAAAAQRGESAVQRGDPGAADDWFLLAEAADDAMLAAATEGPRSVGKIVPSCPAVIGGEFAG